MRAGTLVLLVASFVLAGCGGESETTTVTVQETIVQETPAATTQATTEASPEAEEAPADEAGKIEVPSVVGEDHQLAQDTMQAAGLYNLSEEDVTGEGRMLLFDRNWVVVEQDPPGGALVDPDQTITLRSKKDDE